MTRFELSNNERNKSNRLKLGKHFHYSKLWLIKFSFFIWIIARTRWRTENC